MQSISSTGGGGSHFSLLVHIVHRYVYNFFPLLSQPGCCYATGGYWVRYSASWSASIGTMWKSAFPSPLASLGCKWGKVFIGCEGLCLSLVLSRAHLSHCLNRHTGVYQLEVDLVASSSLRLSMRPFESEKRKVGVENRKKMGGTGVCLHLLPC